MTTKKQQKQQIVQSESVEQSNTDNVKPVKKKSLFKPVLFFGIFALCVEAAVLYPFCKEENGAPLPIMRPKEPAIVLRNEEKDLKNDFVCPECKCPEPSVIIQDC